MATAAMLRFVNTISADFRIFLFAKQLACWRLATCTFSHSGSSRPARTPRAFHNRRSGKNIRPIAPL